MQLHSIKMELPGIKDGTGVNKLIFPEIKLYKFHLPQQSFL